MHLTRHAERPLFPSNFMSAPRVKAFSCGLDFGTSNSAIGIAINDQPQLARFAGRGYIPSTLFFDFDYAEPFFGQEAISRYIDGAEGRIIWSPKNALGTGLIFEKTQVGKKRLSFKEIIALIVKNLKRACEAQFDAELTRVVCGRPVFFNDDDPELDQAAASALRSVLLEAGFEHVELVAEPIAASRHYEQSVQKEQIALVVDMGGGTSDFTVVRLDPQAKEAAQKILSVGGVHLAGTDFDKQLSLTALMPELGLGGNYKSLEGPWLPVPPTLFHELSTWHKIGFVYTPQNIEYARLLVFTGDSARFERLLQTLTQRYGHLLARKVEQTKIELSPNEQAPLRVFELQPPIDKKVSREAFEQAISGYLQKIGTTLSRTVQDAGVKLDDIDAAFLTGGTSLIPSVRQLIQRLLPNAELIQGDEFGSVAMGLTHIAKERWR